jgi:hypothetical protein
LQLFLCPGGLQVDPSLLWQIGQNMDVSFFQLRHSRLGFVLAKRNDLWIIHPIPMCVWLPGIKYIRPDCLDGPDKNKIAGSNILAKWIGTPNNDRRQRAAELKT